MPACNDIAASGCRNKNVADRRHFLHGPDLVSFHRRLQGADRIDFRNDDPGAESSHGLRTPLADIAITADDNNLSGYHDVCASFNPVGQRFAATVKVVEFGLGHRIIDVDGRE